MQNRNADNGRQWPKKKVWLTTLLTTLFVICGVGVEATAAEAPAISHKIGKGMKIAAPTGSWISLRPRVMMLFQRDMPETGVATQALTVRRARLIVKSGYQPLRLSSKLELAFSSRDLSFSGGHPRRTPVLTWSLQWERWRDLRIKVGQFKIGYSRQRLTSSGDLQLVDRSVVQGEFTLDRDIGVELYSKDLGGLDKLGYVIGVYNGGGRDVYKLSTAAPMVLGRLEFTPLGRFDAYKEADLKRHVRPKLAVAAAAAWLQGATNDRGVLGKPPADGGTTDHALLTADLHAKWRGWSLAIEAHKRDSTRKAGTKAPVVAGRSGYGAFGTLGWLLPLQSDVELALRAGAIVADKDSSLTDVQEATVGVSWYLSGHANKLQADVSRLKFGSETEVRVRLQFQASM